jgi:CBS domain-containing protein
MPRPEDQTQSSDSPTDIRTEPVPLVTESDLVNPMLKVADAMTVAPRTCSTASTALEAAMIFRDADCGMVPITDAGKPVGVLTDRDVALALPDHETDLGRTPVGELMTGEVVTIDLDETLEVAMERLGQHGVRRLLVVDGNEVLQGVLSWTDLVPHLSERALGRVVSRIVENR